MEAGLEAGPTVVEHDGAATGFRVQEIDQDGRGIFDRARPSGLVLGRRVPRLHSSTCATRTMLLEVSDKRPDEVLREALFPQESVRDELRDRREPDLVDVAPSFAPGMVDRCGVTRESEAPPGKDGGVPADELVLGRADEHANAGGCSRRTSVGGCRL